MEILINGGFFIIFVAISVVVVVTARSRARGLVRTWRSWARARNWRFHEKWPAVVGPFTKGPFGRGHKRRAFLGYEGVFDGVPAAGFGYSYWTSSGKNAIKHPFHVSMVRIPHTRFPIVAVEPENWAHRVFTDDIEFEDSEFNRLWRVTSSSPRFTHDVIHPRVMHWLKSGSHPGFSAVCFEHDSILMASKGTVSPEEVDARLRFLTQLAGTIPRFVLENVGRAEPLLITAQGPGISLREQRRRIELYSTKTEKLS